MQQPAVGRHARRGFVHQCLTHISGLTKHGMRAVAGPPEWGIGSSGPLLPAKFMTRERLYLFDTTLRDGAQTTGVDFSLQDKRLIARTLDEIGIDYIEGGYPGANPTDTEFFSADPGFAHATFTAFGMTKRAGRSVANDPGFQATLQAKRGRRLPGRQGVGLSRAGGARHLQRGEPGRRRAVDRRRGGQRARGNARLRALLRRLQGQPRLCPQRGAHRPRGGCALGGAVRHQRRHAAR